MERDIRLICTPSRDEVPSLQEEQLVYCLLELVPAAEREEEVRLPLDICLLLDCSSSMRGDRLFQAKEAARSIINQLSSSDYFGLIVFNDRGNVIVPRQPVQAPAAVREHIAEVQASGGTEMARGLELVLQQMQRVSTFAGVRRVILLTDGQTYGDENRCVELARQIQQMGIGITALGLGDEWNEDLLATIAAYGNSRSEYIAGAESIIPLFREEMRLLQGIVAQEMALSLQPATGVKVRNFYRIAPEIAPLPLQENWDKGLVVPLGEWMGANPQVFLAELVVPSLSPGKLRLLHISFSFRLPRERARQEVRQELHLICRTGEPDSARVPEKLRRALEKVTAFRLQESAWQEARRGDIEQATRRLQAAATRLVQMGEVHLAEVIEEEARHLSSTGKSSPVGKKEIHYGTQRLGRGWSGHDQQKRG